MSCVVCVSRCGGGVSLRVVVAACGICVWWLVVGVEFQLVGVLWGGGFWSISIIVGVGCGRLAGCAGCMRVVRVVLLNMSVTLPVMSVAAM